MNPKMGSLGKTGVIFPLLPKTVTWLLSFIVLFPVVSASCNSSGVFDKVASFCVEESNGVCDAGENPLFHRDDCPLKMQDAANFLWIGEGWFLKLAAFFLLMWLLSNVELWSDRNFQVLVLMILVIVFLGSKGIVEFHAGQNDFGNASQGLYTRNASMGGEKVVVQNHTLNGSAVQVIDLDEYSGFSGLWNKVKGFGSAVWPDQPVLGWVLIGFFVFGCLALLRVGLDRVENFFRGLIH